MERHGRFVANLQYAGNYRARLEEYERNGQCPFCEMRKDPALVQLVQFGWWVMDNQFPAKGKGGTSATRHLLLIPTRHITLPREMDSQDWEEIGELVRSAEQRFGVAGGGLLFRFGDPKRGGQTIRHIHLHLIEPGPHPEPNMTTGWADPVYFPIG